MTFRILFTYMDISDRALPLKALNVADSMTGNANFPNAAAMVTSLRTLALSYQDQLSLALLGDERAISLKNQKREELKAALHELAAHVLGVAKNNPEILASSGFDISRERAGIKTETLSINTGKDLPGQALSIMRSIKGARVYFHQYTPDPLTPDSVWTEVIAPGRKYVHTGLTSGAKYWFRARAFGKDGQEIYTDHVLMTVH